MTPLMTCIYNLSQVKDFALKIYNYIILNNIKIIFLRGDVGSGKTTFMKTLLQELNPELEVVSPTYTYVNEYLINDKHIWHFDLYRIENNEEITDLGIIDYLTREDGLAFIEWPEKCNFLEINKYKKITLHFFHIEDKNERACVISQ
jgi:tRNA threonylcarbamoyladenosine biosynthesis protein TsaE